jgi:ABC-type sugar transport system ATPase subunit
MREAPRYMSALSIQKLTKIFNGREMISDVSLKVESGEFIVLVGPSGCGKSTILRMIAGLEKVTSGSIFIDEEDVTQKAASRRGIAMVFQSYALYPHMTVRENLSFGLKNMKFSRAVISDQVGRAAETLQLSELLDRLPSQLSGGQRQRVAIGRAIVRNPKIFLFDEPLSNLDTELRVQMRHELTKLHRQLKSTMIYVTHDQVEALTLADKIVVLNNGRIEQIGAPLELYNRPANGFTAGFIGSPKINMFQGRILSHDGCETSVRLEGGTDIMLDAGSRRLEVGDAITLGIRPEHASLTECAQSIAFDLELNAIEALGHSTFLYASLGTGQDFRIKLDGHHDMGKADHVRIYVGRRNILIFDHHGKALQACP